MNKHAFTALMFIIKEVTIYSCSHKLTYTDMNVILDINGMAVMGFQWFLWRMIVQHVSLLEKKPKIVVHEF